MGIEHAVAKLLLKEASVESYTGSVLQLGRQDIFFSSKELKQWADEVNVSLDMKAPIQPNRSGTLVAGNIDDISFFRLLGFESVFSVDNSDYEKASLILDLNLPVPEDFHNKFDMIFDGGTMEHVFNVFQVLKNIFSMLKTGGRIIHTAPSSNFVDHGFYMFSPTLFWDFYQTNKWRVKTCNLLEFGNNRSLPWLIYEYTPGCIDHLSMGGFRGKRALATWFVAEKTTHSTGTVIPQQGSYVKAWAKTRVMSDEKGGQDRPSMLWKIKDIFKRRYPLLFRAVKFIAWPCLRLKMPRVKMPRVIAKL